MSDEFWIMLVGSGCFLLLLVIALVGELLLRMQGG